MANLHGMGDFNDQNGNNNRNGIGNRLISGTTSSQDLVYQSIREEKVPFLLITLEGDCSPLQESIPYTCKLAWCPKVKLLSFSTLLIAAIWILFIICCTQGLRDKQWSLLAISGQVLLDFGAVNGNLVVYDYQYWRLITGAFLHADLLHITGNTIFLLLFLTQFEHIYPLYCNIPMLLISAICGNSLSITFRMQTIGVGSSSMIFGAIGCLVGYLVINWRYLGQLKGQLACLFIFIGILALLSSMGESVDVAGHIGGIIAGPLCMMAFYPSMGTKNKIIMYIGIAGLSISLLLIILLMILR